MRNYSGEAYQQRTYYPSAEANDPRYAQDDKQNALGWNTPPRAASTTYAPRSFDLNSQRPRWKGMLASPANWER